VKKNASPKDPYVPLFSVGALSIVVGIFIWIFFQHDLLRYYPKQAHGNIMFFGFLWSFIAGFVMTAVPRMTGAAVASVFEVLMAVCFSCLQLALNLGNFTNASLFLFFVQIIFLILFLSRRLLEKKQIPFEGFVFFPFAFLQGILGVGIFLIDDPSRTDLLYLLSGEAFALNLILGIGSRLIPVISRIPNALSPHARIGAAKTTPALLLAIVFNLSFYIQLFIREEWGVALRLVVVFYIAVKHLKLFSKGTSFSWVGLGLKIGLVFILLSYVGSLFHANPIATKHLLYLGGFALITLMVATRVMLSHGGESLDYEGHSKRIFLVIALMVVAVVFRFLAGSDIFSGLMTTSALAALGAIFIWFYKFFKTLKI
jgi:uncharacterized protein involved in response to NO